MEPTDFFQTVFPNSVNQNTNDSNTEFSFKFPHPVNLIGEYEVGLIESFIPYNLFNIEKEEFMQVEYYCSARELVDMSNIARVHRTVAESRMLWNALSEMFPIATDQYDELAGWKYSMEKYFLLYAFKVKIEAGFFDNINELIGIIKRRIRFLTELHKRFEVPVPPPKPDEIKIGEWEHNIAWYNIFLEGKSKTHEEFYIGNRKIINLNKFLNRIKFVKGQKKIHVEPENQRIESVVKVKVGSSLAKLFGWDKEEFVFHSNEYYESKHMVRFNPFGEMLLIYCDIIENPIVHNEFNNLLKVLCLPNSEVTFGNYHNREFKNTQYTSLNTTHLSSLRIYLRNLQGERILFQDSLQPCMLTLHFRPINRTFSI